MSPGDISPRDLLSPVNSLAWIKGGLVHLKPLVNDKSSTNLIKLLSLLFDQAFWLVVQVDLLALYLRIHYSKSWIRHDVLLY